MTKEKITSRTIFFLLKCSLILFWVHPSLLCFSLYQTEISSCAEYAVWMNVERHMVCGTPHQQECTSEPSSFLPCLSLTSDQSNVKMFHRCFVHPQCLILKAHFLQKGSDCLQLIQKVHVKVSTQFKTLLFSL